MVVSENACCIDLGVCFVVESVVGSMIDYRRIDVALCAPPYSRRKTSICDSHACFPGPNRNQRRSNTHSHLPNYDNDAHMVFKYEF